MLVPGRRQPASERSADAERWRVVDERARRAPIPATSVSRATRSSRLGGAAAAGRATFSLVLLRDCCFADSGRRWSSGDRWCCCGAGGRARSGTGSSTTDQKVCSTVLRYKRKNYCSIVALTRDKFHISRGREALQYYAWRHLAQPGICLPATQLANSLPREERKMGSRGHKPSNSAVDK